MSLKAIFVRLDEDILIRARQIAEAKGISRDWLMAHAIKQYVEHEEWLVREVEEGIQAAIDGKLVDHLEIKAIWKAKHAAQVD